MKGTNNSIASKHPKRIIGIALGLWMLLSMLGCSPDNLTVTVGTAAVESVRAGGEGMAKAKVVFSTIDGDDVEEIALITRVIRRYLGDFGALETDRDEMMTTFTASLEVPVVRAEKLSAQHGVVLAVVLHPNGHLEVAEGPRFQQLNHDLENVNGMLGIDLNGGKHTFRLVGNSGAALSARVYGAFVDGKATPTGIIRVFEGDWVEVRFDRGGGSVYEKIAPFLELM